MVLDFNKNIFNSLKELEHHDYQELIIHNQEILRDINNSCTILQNYGDQNWKILNLINETYQQNFDHYNWINKKDDEIAHFLNEVGANCLNHSEFKAPAALHLWLGKEGFIIGIEQLGNGFNALDVDKNKVKVNEGAAFDFFRNCQSKVFFDNPTNAKMVFLEWKINQ